MPRFLSANAGRASSSQDTTNCPVGSRCESCGRPDDPRVTTREYHPTAETYCITLCPRCRASGVPPRISEVTAGRFLAQHAAHLHAAANPDDAARADGEPGAHAADRDGRAVEQVRPHGASSRG